MNLSDIIKHVGVTDEQLDQECSDALLLEIAQKIVTYQRYAHKLGLSDPEIISFQHNMTVANDVRLITAEVFKSWHRKQAYLATYRALAMVAAQLGDKSGAQIICEICAKGKFNFIVLIKVTKIILDPMLHWSAFGKGFKPQFPHALKCYIDVCSNHLFGIVQPMGTEGSRPKL